MKKILLTLCLMLAGISGATAQWCVIGDFSGWDPATAPEMTEQADGTWTVTLDELEGAFKFLKGHDYNWEQYFDADYQSMVYGNGTIPVKSYTNKNLIASYPMKNVTITLNPEAQTATFEGLPQDMDEVDPTKPYAINKGCFLIGDPAGEWRPDTGFDMTRVENNLYSATLSMKAGARFRISGALINVPEGEGMELEAWKALNQYEYIPAIVTDEMKSAGVSELTPGNQSHLQTQNPYDLNWEVPENGTYTFHVDLDANTMMVERDGMRIYVCGYVENPVSEVKNGFLAPSAGDRKTYEENFALKEIADNVFQGEFIIYTYAGQPFSSTDDYPQLRFFSDLLGWISDASLGSHEDDFYCLPVELTDFPITFPIIEKGLGNWGFHEGGYWENQTVKMTVDLNKMEVTFALPGGTTDTSVSEISINEEEPLWFDLQGNRVQAPSNGVYIRVTPSGSEKIHL